jgi:hypothetical protein
MFSAVTMYLGSGRTLQISSKGEGIYAHGIQVNGRPHLSTWLKLSALSARQNHVEFELQLEPDHMWATKEAEFPPSFDAAGNLTLQESREASTSEVYDAFCITMAHGVVNARGSRRSHGAKASSRSFFLAEN